MNAIAAWFLTPQSALWAVALRVAIGGILACWFSQVLEHAPLLLGPNGIGRVLPPGIEPNLPGLPYSLFPGALLLNLPSDGAATAVASIAIVLSLLFAVGCCTRSVGVLLILTHFAVWGRAPLATYGWPQELGQFLVLVLLADPGRYASVDAWLRTRGSEKSWRVIGAGPGWPLRLTQIHVAAMYAAAGFPRLDDWAWLQGYTVFVALSSGEFARFDVDYWPYRHVLAVLNWGVVLLEPLAAFLLWIPRLRGWILLGLLGMHAGLELTGHIGWWQWTMAASLLAFAPPAILANVAARLGLRATTP